MTTAQALARLTERQRTLIRLRDEEKQTWKQVATEVGLSPNYCTILWKEAKAALRRWEATDEKMLYDPRDYGGRVLIDGKPTEGELMMDKLKATGWPHQTPPDPIPAPAEATAEENALAKKKLLESLPAPGTSPTSPPPRFTVVTGVVQDPPKVMWVVGVPVPAQG